MDQVYFSDSAAVDVIAAQVPPKPFEEQHYPVTYWAKRWGFSAKTVRAWFAPEVGPGVLRHRNTGRRKKRDYVTLMISLSAAARVYEKHTAIS